MSTWTHSLLGAVAALAAAFIFSVASLVFQRLGRSIPPSALNLGKGAISVTFTAATVLLLGYHPVPPVAVFFLCVSGFLGITVGDTAYFHALQALGPRRTLLMDTLGPGLTCLLSVLVLGEHLEGKALVGIVATLSGVGLVMAQRQGGGGGGGDIRRGLLWALVSMSCHSFGVLLSKTALDQVPALEASLVRQSFGVVMVMVGLAASREGFAPVRSLADPHKLAALVAISFFSTFIGIWLSMVALKLTSASIASTLTATGPLFILPLSRIFNGERVTLQALAGAALAVAGVALLFAVTR